MAQKETALTHINLPVFWLGIFFCVTSVLRLRVSRPCVWVTSSQKPWQCKKCSETLLISQQPYANTVQDKAVGEMLLSS